MLRRLLAHRSPPATADFARLREDARLAAESGDLARARAGFERLLALQPRSPEAHSDLGNVYLLLGADREAERHYVAALALAPDHAPALANRGLLRARQGDRGAALDCFRRAIRADPRSAAAIRSLADWLPDAELPHEDIALLREITTRFPDHAAAFAALGRLLTRGKFDAEPALAAAERALELGHDEADTRVVHGVALHELGRFDAALSAYDAALARDPQHVPARFHRAITLLTLGRFADGWPDYELRLKSEDRPQRNFPFPRWEGESLTGKTLLVYAEQGIGDEILFASCLQEVVAAADHCVIDCAPKLAALFQRSFPTATVHGGYQTEAVDWAGALGIDLQLPAGSLPLVLQRDSGDFPAHTGYLRADPVKVARWRERLRSLGPGPAIGVSWRGGTLRTRSDRRSLGPAELAPILGLSGFSFVSLQYQDDAAAQVAQLAADTGLFVHHWREAIDDYDETAALVVALDGVVSVCTAIVHLAGALGRPVWVATPRVPEWRYGATGDRIPWYPSARLVRQGNAGGWAPVVEAIRNELLLAMKPGPASR